MDLPGRRRDGSGNSFLTLISDSFVRCTQGIRDGLPVAGQHRVSSNLAARLQILLLSTLVFASLAGAGFVIVGLVDHQMQPVVTHVSLGALYALVILISASLSLLVHRRLRRDGELTWAYRTLGEGAEEREVNAVVDEVARIVTSTLDINDVYQQFGEELSKLVDCDRMAVMVTGQESETMEFKYIYGLKLPTHIQGEVVPLDGTRTKLVVESQNTHVWEDTNSPQDFRTERNLAALGLRAGITTPLVSKGQVFGVLDLRSTRHGRRESLGGWPPRSPRRSRMLNSTRKAYRSRENYGRARRGPELCGTWLRRES